MDYTKLISDDVFCFKMINNDIVIGKVVEFAGPSVLLISRPLELVFVENDDDDEDFNFSGFGRIPTSFYLIPYLFPAISAKTVVPINIMHIITFNKVTPMLRSAYLETLEKIDNNPNDIDDEAFTLEKEGEQDNDKDSKKKRYLH